MEPHAELRRERGGRELSAARFAEALEAISRDGLLLDAERAVTSGASIGGTLTSWCVAAL
jgi:hypothetical protein